MGKPTEAAIRLRDAFAKKTGYYLWEAYDEALTLYVRTPNPEMFEKETWLEEESITVIHMCDITAYWAAVDACDTEASSKYTGYCRNGKCLKCMVEVPVWIGYAVEKDWSSAELQYAKD